MTATTDITERIRKIKAASQALGGWDMLDAKLRSAYERDRRGGRLIADGYPTGTMGGIGGGATVTTEDPDTGDDVKVPVTSVEAAVINRLDARTSRDEWHRQVTRALEWLDEASRAVGAFKHCMDKLDELDGNKPAVEHCASCASIGVEELDLDLPLRFGKAGDALERNVWLCRSCYRFATNHRRLPDPDELQRYRNGKALRPWRERGNTLVISNQPPHPA